MSVKGLRRYKVASFDMIGTLIDFESGILNYVRPIAEEAGISIADTAILEAFGWAEAKQHRAAPDTSFTEMLGPSYREMAGVLGLPTAREYVEGLAKSIPNWPPFADALESLELLGKHLRLVALTNADNWAYWYFSRTLGEPFDDKVTAEEVGVSKPDPQMFAYCLGRQSVHGFARKDVLHVAQSQYHDIGVATRLGYATAWIERRKGKVGHGATPEPDEIVTPTYHYSDLASLAADIVAVHEG